MSGLGPTLVAAGYVITIHNKTSLLGLAFSLTGVIVSLVELASIVMKVLP